MFIVFVVEVFIIPFMIINISSVSHKNYNHISGGKIKVANKGNNVFLKVSPNTQVSC